MNAWNDNLCGKIPTKLIRSNLAIERIARKRCTMAMGRTSEYQTDAHIKHMLPMMLQNQLILQVDACKTGLGAVIIFAHGCRY